MRWHTTTQTIGWFKDRAADGSLSLSEPYQRRPVWGPRQRCFLVESVLLGCPIPEVFIQMVTTPAGMSTHNVVDGQQRIRSILKFLGLDREDAEDNGFALTKLDLTSMWYGVDFESLSDEVKQSFYMYEVGVRYLQTEDQVEIRDMFMRLNRFGAPLTGQELRNAAYWGPLIRLSEKMAEDKFFVEQGIVTLASVRRMGDIEFVSELLLGTMYGPQDGSAAGIDKHYRELEDEEELPGQAKTTNCYRMSLGLIKKWLPDLQDTRWSNKHDFYSLFVATAHYVREGYKRVGKTTDLRINLARLARYVAKYIEDEEAKVPGYAQRYARAIQKGPNSRARRGARHREMLKVLSPFFKKP